MKRLKYMLDPLTGSIAFLSFAHWEYSSLIQVLLLLAHCHQVRLYVGMLWVLIGAVTWLWEEITKTRWGREIKRRGGYDSSAQCYRHVHVEYQCEVARIFSDHESAGAMDSSLTTHTSSSQTIPTASNPQTTPTSSSSTSFQATSSSPLHVELTNGRVYTCDLVVSATGVIPNTTLLHCHVTENKVCLMMRRVRIW